MKARILNNEYKGTFPDYYISKNYNKIINGQLVSEWTMTEILPTEEEMLFVKLCFDGDKYYEGATVEEINFEKIKILTELKPKIFSKIKRYALALAMGKSVDDDLEYYETAYRQKYQRAKDFLSGAFSDALGTFQTESILEGFETPTTYANYIITAFEKGENFQKVAYDMSEVLRKLLLKDEAEMNYDKAIARCTIIDELPDTVQATQIGAIFNQVLSL